MAGTPVAFQGGGARFSADLVDISTTGLLMRCEESVDLGTTGRIAFPVGHETCRIVAVARRRVAGTGVAFEFSHMSPHDRELLRRLLLRLSSKPSAQ